MNRSEEIQLNGKTYIVECIHGGQYHPYGDTFRVFNIKCDDDDPNNILKIMKIHYGYEVPLKKDWNQHNIFSYFEGYCEVVKTDDGFKYTKCEPYTD